MVDVTINLPDDKLVYNDVRYEPIPGVYRCAMLDDMYWDGIGVCQWKCSTPSVCRYVILQPVKLVGMNWLNSLADKSMMGVFQYDRLMYTCYPDNGWWCVRRCYKSSPSWWRMTDGKWLLTPDSFDHASDDTVTWLDRPFVKV